MCLLLDGSVHKKRDSFGLVAYLLIKNRSHIHNPGIMKGSPPWRKHGGGTLRIRSMGGAVVFDTTLDHDPRNRGSSSCDIPLTASGQP